MPDNEVKSWGQYGPNNKYFRGLQGLKFDNQDISSIPDYHAMDFENYVQSNKAFYDKNSDRNPEEDYLKIKIAEDLGKETYKSEYKGLPYNEMLSKYKSSKQKQAEILSKNRELQEAEWSKEENIYPDLAKLDEEDREYLMGLKFGLVPERSFEENMQRRLLRDEIKNNPYFTEDESKALLSSSNYYMKYFSEENPTTKLPNSKEFSADLNKYSNDIYKKAMLSDFNRVKYLTIFDSVASKVDPYYKESQLYDGLTHNIEQFVTEADKAKLMSQYLAISALTNNEDLAREFLQEKLTELRANTIGFGEKFSRTVRGIGADVYGSTLTLAGAALNLVLPDSIAEAVGLTNGDEEALPDDLDVAFWQRWLYDLSNNNLTKQGIKALNTGIAGITKSQKLRQKYNEENNINDLDLTFSKGWNLVQQSGYTTASIISTLGASLLVKGLQKGITWAAKTGTKVAKKELAKATAKTVENCVNKAAKYTVVPIMNSYAEAVQDGFDVFDQVKSQGEQLLQKASYDDFVKDLQYDEATGEFFNDEFREFYNSRATNKKKFDALQNQMMQEYGNGIPEGDITEFKAKQQMLKELQEASQKEMQNIAEEYYNTKYKPIIESPEAQKRVLSEAVRAFANTTATEQVIISITDNALSHFLAPELKFLKKKFRYSTNGMIKATKAGEKVAATAYNYIGKVARDVISEGGEELLQTVSQDTYKHLADTDLMNYYYNSMNADSRDSLGYGMFSNIGQVAKAAGQSFISGEAWKAFAQGSMGALIGAADGNIIGIRRRLNDVSNDAKIYGYNKLEKAAGYINAVWRTPLLYNITDRRQHIANANQVVGEINRRLEEDKQFASAFQSATGLVSYMNAFNAAREADDAVAMEDSDFATFIEGANIMSKLKDTSYGRAMEQTFSQIEKASLSDPAMQELVEQLRDSMNIQGQTMSDEEILNMLKGRVNKFRQTTKDLTEQFAEIDHIYGGAVDDRTKNALAYTKLTQKNKEQMIKTREQLISQAISSNSALQEQQRASSSLDNVKKKIIAQYGSLEKAEETYKREKDAKPSQRTLTKTQMKALKRNIRDMKKSEGEQVLNAYEILKLGPVERAEILNPKNRNRYSAEQREVIDEVMSLNLGADVMTAIDEAGRIQDALDKNNRILSDLEGSSSDIRSLSYSLFINSNITNANKKLAPALATDTYEDFEEELDKIIDGGRLTETESAMIEHLLSKGNKAEFYKKYQDRLSNAQMQEGILDNIKDRFNKKHNTVIKETLRELIKRNKGKKEGYNLNDATNLLTDNGFLNTLREKGINWETMSQKEKDTVLAELSEFISLFNNGISNAAELIKKFNEEHTPDTRDSNEGSRTSNTIFNKEVYIQNKNMYNTLFERIASIFKTNEGTLNNKELFQLLSLLNKNVTTAVDSDVTSIPEQKCDISSLISVNKVYKTLVELLNKNKTFYGDQHNFAVLTQMTEGLAVLRSLSKGKTPIEAIGEAIIEINPQMKDNFDKKIITDSKKKQVLQRPKKGDMTLRLELPQSITDELKAAFYLEHNIIDNQIWVCEHMNPKDVKMVIMKHPDLIDSELTYDSDNFPLVAAIEVDENVPNAVEIDGNYYLYVGTVANSRESVTSELTIMNSIRDYVITDFNDEEHIIKWEDSGEPIVFAGWNIRRTEQPADKKTLNYISEYLTKPKEEGGLGLSREEAFKHFKENVVRTSSTYTKNEETGRITVVTTFKWKGNDYTRKSTADSMPNSAEKETKYSNIAYINPSEVFQETPYPYFLRTNLANLNTEGITLIQALQNENLFDTKFESGGLMFANRMLNTLKKDISNKITIAKLTSKKYQVTTKKVALQKLEDDFNKDAGAYFNFDKLSGRKANLRFKFNIKDNNLTILFGLLGSNENFTKVVIDLNDLSNLEEQLQQLIRDSILEKNGDEYSYRTYETDKGTQDIIKPQVSYLRFTDAYKADKDKSEENDKFLRMYFDANCLYGDDNWLQVKPEEISSTVVEEKKPQTVQTAASRVGATPVEAVEVPIERKTINEKVDAVMNKMKEFIFSAAKLDEARSESHIGVTTFITKGPKKSVSNQATEFGTSCDTIARIFFSDKGGFNAEQTYNYIYNEYAKRRTDDKSTPERCIMPGFTWPYLREYLNSIETNLKTFFENRGEQVVPFDLLFKGKLTSESGKFAKLTAIPDIVTVDEQGMLHIYDMKSYRMDSLNLVSVDSFGPADMRIANGSWMRDNIKKWQKQVSLYAHLIEKVTGLQVASVGIIPIPLNYKEEPFVLSGDKDNFTKAMAVSKRDGKTPYTFEAAPKMYNDAIRMEVLPISEIESDKWIDSTETAIQETDTGGVNPTSEPEKVAEVKQGLTDTPDTGLVGLTMQRGSKARDRLAKYRKTTKEAEELNEKCPK